MMRASLRVRRSLAPLTNRAIGLFASMYCTCCPVICLRIAVRDGEGVTAFTVVPVWASSLPNDLVNWTSPACEQLLVSIQDMHACAGCDHAFGDGKADALRAAGNDSGPPFKVDIVHSNPSIDADKIVTDRASLVCIRARSTLEISRVWLRDVSDGGPTRRHSWDRPL